MRSKRLVRQIPFKTKSEYTVNGIYLTEKMRRYLRARFGDTPYKKIFSNLDVVYRFNPNKANGKGKMDVWVGNIVAAKHTNGNTIKLGKIRSFDKKLSDVYNEFYGFHAHNVSYREGIKISVDGVVVPR